MVKFKGPSLGEKVSAPREVHIDLLMKVQLRKGYQLISYPCLE